MHVCKAFLCPSSSPPPPLSLSPLSYVCPETRNLTAGKKVNFMFVGLIVDDILQSETLIAQHNTLQMQIMEVQKRKA